jgi:AspT/YidE/YbjL antiporter-like protein
MMCAMGFWSTMFREGSTAQAILVLSGVASLGLLLGHRRVLGVRVGIMGVLFTGLLFGHFGVKINPEMLEFVREFGLIFFVYAIGMQVGPGIFSSWRKQGLSMNLLAASVVLTGALTCWAIAFSGRVPLLAAIGLYTGAVTNTPSLGAAQQALGEIAGVAPESLKFTSVGYALAYPFGIVGTILAMLAVRRIFRLDLRTEAQAWEESQNAERSSLRTNLRLQFEDSVRIAGEEEVTGRAAGALGNSRTHLEQPPVLPVFIGMVLGVLLGSIPIPLPGVPAGLKLGLAGGPLIVAMVLARVYRIGPVVWYLPGSANFTLRELGIVLFLSCVGLKAGGPFVETLLSGGWVWMLWGAVITVVPLLAGAVVARLLLKMNFLSLCGWMSGCMTDPPALAYAGSLANSDAPAISYATVYPLVMLLRVLSAQVLVIILAH